MKKNHNRRRSLVYAIALKSGSAECAGIEKKIEQSVSAAQKLGWYATSLNLSANPLVRIKELLSLKTDVVIFRTVITSALLQAIGFLVLRLKGIKVIVDIPTPLNVAYCELIAREEKTLIIKALRIALFNVSFPVSLWPANLIIENGEERGRFKIGLKSKSVFMGNGIDVDAITPIPTPSFDECTPLRIIAVANVSFWHGYDRLIRSIYKYSTEINKQDKRNTPIRLYVVGCGDALESLKSLVTELEIEDTVKFLGFKLGRELDQLYMDSHLGVCSLGLHRKYLDVATELKAREYASKGLPFIMESRDPDFPNDLSFVFRVSYNEELIDINKVVAWYREIYTPSLSGFIRSYAKKTLRLDKKLEQVLRRLNA